MSSKQNSNGVLVGVQEIHGLAAIQLRQAFGSVDIFNEEERITYAHSVYGEQVRICSDEGLLCATRNSGQLSLIFMDESTHVALGWIFEKDAAQKIQAHYAEGVFGDFVAIKGSKKDAVAVRKVLERVLATAQRFCAGPWMS